MSETCWSLVPVGPGRLTSKKLGEDSETAVIRWKSKYRIIKVVDRLPPVSLLWIFGCESPVVLMSRVGVDVLVNCRGLSLSVKSWVLRSERTIPPGGPRACMCVSESPERAGHWSLTKPVGTRCVVLRKRTGRCTEYRGVFWQSPLSPGSVLIQGVDVLWELLVVSEMCVVRFKSLELRVHRSCLIKK